MVKKIYLIEFVAVIILYLFFYENPVLYPLRIFLTMTHESFHALATLLTGGKVISIHLNGIEGRTISQGGVYLIIALSGYIGTALLGSLIIATKYKKTVLVLYIMLISYMTFVYTKFSIEYLVITFFLWLLIFVLYKAVADHIVFVLGSFLALHSIEDMKMYLLKIPGETDAGLIAKYLGSPLYTLPVRIFMFLTCSLILFVGVKSFLKSRG